MIQEIQLLCVKHDKLIGIIVELKGRRIKVEKFPKDQNAIHFKQGERIKIVTQGRSTDKENIVINFKDLYKMLSPGDKIIINENIASLTVEKVVELVRQRSKTKLASVISMSNLPIDSNQYEQTRLLNNCLACQESQNQLQQTSSDQNYSEKTVEGGVPPLKAHSHLPRVKTYCESDINILLQRVDIQENCKNNDQEINDMKLIELEQDHFLKIEERDRKPSDQIQTENTDRNPSERKTKEEKENEVNFEDFNNLLDKIDHFDKGINTKLRDFEQNHMFEVDEEEVKNIESQKINGFIQSVADFSEMKYNEKKNREEYEVQIDNIKDISSIKSGEVNLNSSNTCVNCQPINNLADSALANKTVSINQIPNSSNMGMGRRKGSSKLKKPMFIKKHEINCTVDYDCYITKNSFLYIPDLNYKKFDIDLLSSREVAEIEGLDKLNVDFICISIVDSDDIELIKSILSDNTNLKIIASIPDFRTLKNLDDILNYSCAVVLSRTFQILNKTSRHNITQLTKSLISKSRSIGKPIYSYLDLEEGVLCQRSQEISKIKDVMYSVMDGMDGFFVSIINHSSECSFENHLKILGKFSNYIRTFQNELYFDFHIFHAYQDNLPPNSSLGILCQLVKKYSECIKELMIIYFGDDREDLENFSKIRFKSFVTVVSTNEFFLKYAKLHFGITSLKIPEMTTQQELEKFVMDKIDYETNLILFVNDRKTGMRKIKILSEK